MLFNVSCKTGRLQVDDTTVRVVSGKRIVWSTLRRDVTYISVKKGVLADVVVYTTQHHFPAQFLTRQDAGRFVSLFPGVPTGLPIVPQHVKTSVRPAANVAAKQPLPPGAKKKTPVWAYVVSIVAVLAFCGCIGSFMVNAFSGASSQANTPPASPTSGNAVTLAATAATLPPTKVPTAKPTPKPTVKPTPKPTPRPVPTQPPAPPPTQPPSCQGVNSNPWCYNFTPGNLIYTPPSGFCNYFNCIPSFYGSDDPGDGYINECADGTYSQSGGERGDCSYHGGELRPLYAH